MTAPFDRAATLTKNLRLEKQGLEIGPLDKPIVPEKGTTVLYADHLPTRPRAEPFLTGDALTSRESKVLL